MLIDPELIAKTIEERREKLLCLACGADQEDGYSSYEQDVDGYTVDIKYCSNCSWEEGEDPEKYFSMNCLTCDGSGCIEDYYRETGLSTMDCPSCRGTGKWEN